MWFIACPVWGKNYIHTFVTSTLPAINAALDEAELPARFLIHTDEPSAFYGAGFRGDVEFAPVKTGKCFYTTFGNCHRDALGWSEPGDYISFLTADILVSKECFRAAERRFAEGKKAIMVTAARTLVPPHDCPSGMASRELLEWSIWGHRHPVTEGCFWGRGQNTVTWAIYFEGENGTVLRAFHLHPFAVVNDRPLHFERATADLDLIERFDKSEIHVVTDPDEMAFAEISGLDKVCANGRPLSVESTVAWAKRHATPLHRWLFSHRVVVRGTGDDTMDEEPARQILSILG